MAAFLALDLFVRGSPKFPTWSMGVVRSMCPARPNGERGEIQAEGWPFIRFVKSKELRKKGKNSDEPWNMATLLWPVKGHIRIVIVLRSLREAHRSRLNYCAVRVH